MRQLNCVKSSFAALVLLLLSTKAFSQAPIPVSDNEYFTEITLLEDGQMYLYEKYRLKCDDLYHEPFTFWTTQLINNKPRKEMLTLKKNGVKQVFVSTINRSSGRQEVIYNLITSSNYDLTSVHYDELSRQERQDLISSFTTNCHPSGYNVFEIYSRTENYLWKLNDSTKQIYWYVKPKNLNIGKSVVTVKLPENLPLAQLLEEQKIAVEAKLNSKLNPAIHGKAVPYQLDASGNQITFENNQTIQPGEFLTVRVNIPAEYIKSNSSNWMQAWQNMEKDHNLMIISLPLILFSLLQFPTLLRLCRNYFNGMSGRRNKDLFN